MRHLLQRIADMLHEMLHRMRCTVSTAYADAAALAADQDTQEFIRECRTNDWAHELRRHGYDVSVGTVLAGVRVTR